LAPERDPTCNLNERLFTRSTSAPLYRWQSLDKASGARYQVLLVVREPAGRSKWESQTAVVVGGVADTFGGADPIACASPADGTDGPGDHIALATAVTTGLVNRSASRM
jgi:hypothetical protein